MQRWVWAPGAVVILLVYSAFMLNSEYHSAADFYVIPAVLGFASSLVTALYFCIIPAVRRNKVTKAAGSILAFLSVSLAGAALVDVWQHLRTSGELLSQQASDSLFPAVAAGILAVVVIIRLVYIDSRLP